MRLKPDQADIRVEIVRDNRLVAVVLRVAVCYTTAVPPPQTVTHFYAAKGVAIHHRDDRHSPSIGLRVAVAHALEQLALGKVLRAAVWRALRQEILKPTYRVIGHNVVHERINLQAVREEVKVKS